MIQIKFNNKKTQESQVVANTKANLLPSGADTSKKFVHKAPHIMKKAKTKTPKQELRIELSKTQIITEIHHKPNSRIQCKLNFRQHFDCNIQS